MLDTPSLAKLALPTGADHPPRILILYGSLRPQSFSRKLALEAERILRRLGAETRVFDPHELPILDSVPTSHPKVQELRAVAVVRGPGLGQPRAARCGNRRVQESDRLAAA